MSKITKKDIKELRNNLERKVLILEREIDGIEGKIVGLGLAIATLLKMEEK